MKVTNAAIVVILSKIETARKRKDDLSEVSTFYLITSILVIS